MNKWLEILFGLIVLIGAILVIFYSSTWTWLGLSWNFKHAAWIVLKGGLIWFVIMIGLLFILLGISDLKE
jgi:hypothetical protein